MVVGPPLSPNTLMWDERQYSDPAKWHANGSRRGSTFFAKRFNQGAPTPPSDAGRARFLEARVGRLPAVPRRHIIRSFQPSQPSRAYSRKSPARLAREFVQIGRPQPSCFVLRPFGTFRVKDLHISAACRVSSSRRLPSASSGSLPVVMRRDNRPTRFTGHVGGTCWLWNTGSNRRFHPLEKAACEQDRCLSQPLIPAEREGLEQEIATGSQWFRFGPERAKLLATAA